jgi:prepilin-type N-terminal cleavage/methylation domain-containing protein
VRKFFPLPKSSDRFKPAARWRSLESLLGSAERPAVVDNLKIANSGNLSTLDYAPDGLHNHPKLIHDRRSFGQRPPCRRFKPVGVAAFTLVEVLVTVALVSIALVGVMGGIASLTKADIRAQDAVLLQQLAGQKLHEITQTTDPRTAETSGDFTEQGHSDITWEQTLEASGTENVEVLSVTTTKTNNGNAQNQTQTLTELVYVAPVTLGASTIGGSR